ncbi:hypothetical protein SLE2022_166930 [Rubroshorea leprosula]
MGTEILRPQDCLIDRIRVSPAACSRRRYGGNQNANGGYNYNARFNRKPVRYEQRKRPESSISTRSSSVDDLKTVRNDMVMGNVTILRRGESLGARIRSNDSLKRESDGGDLVVTGTDRLGPDPEMVPKQIRIVDIRSPGKTAMYAGSAFAVSPSPSSLPLPSFSTKKQAPICDSATRDLRRLLRLDL